MELKHLHTFLILSDLKNFTKTAEYLHYAQSNVTTQIRQLEEELQVRLFERMGRGVSLTTEGTQLIPYARRMFHLSNDIKLKFSQQKSGPITIGASESLCIYRLPKIIRAFKALHPTVEIYLNVLDTADFLPILSDNRIDIAFALDAPICNPGIQTALQEEEAICAFCSPEYSIAGKDHVSIDDFMGMPLILTGKGCCYRKKFESDLERAGIKPRIVLETTSLQVIKQAVLSGLGVCILPLMAVQEELDQELLVRLPYGMDYDISSQLIYHKDKWVSQSMKDFIDIVKLS